MNSTQSALLLISTAAILTLGAQSTRSQTAATATAVPTSLEPRGVFPLDVDRDGLQDLLVVRGGRAVLLANQGGGVFEDASERLGLGARHRRRRSVRPRRRRECGPVRLGCRG